MSDINCQKCNGMIGSVSVNEAFINIICNSCWNDWIENQTKIINLSEFSNYNNKKIIKVKLK